jgi:hypothetical protein
MEPEGSLLCLQQFATRHNKLHEFSQNCPYFFNIHFYTIISFSEWGRRCINVVDNIIFISTLDVLPRMIIKKDSTCNTHKKRQINAKLLSKSWEN